MDETHQLRWTEQNRLLPPPNASCLAAAPCPVPIPLWPSARDPQHTELPEGGTVSRSNFCPHVPGAGVVVK